MSKQRVAFVDETSAVITLLSLMVTMLLLSCIWLNWLTAEPKSDTSDPNNVAIDALLPYEQPLEPGELRVRTDGEWELPGTGIMLPVQSLEYVPATQRPLPPGQPHLK